LDNSNGRSKMPSEMHSFATEGQIRPFLEKEARVPRKSPLRLFVAEYLPLRQENRNSRLSVILIIEGADGRKTPTLVWNSRFAWSGDVESIECLLAHPTAAILKDSEKSKGRSKPRGGFPLGGELSRESREIVGRSSEEAAPRFLRVYR